MRNAKSWMGLWAVLGLAVAGFTVSSAHAEAAHTPQRYAVCVGLNKYKSSYIGSDSWLTGCVKDAKHVSSNLVERGEWTDSTVTMLLNSAGTKSAIRKAITNAAATCASGDVFFYFHSSHGGSDDDGLDVYLCAYDNDYTDRELAKDLAKFKSGVKVVVMVDACHSGGLFKGVRGRRAMARAVPGDFDLAARVSAQIDAIRTDDRIRGVRAARIASSEIGWLTAADYDQYSWDGDDGGEFTCAAMDGWVTGECDEDPYGDGNGYASAYELWNYAKDFAQGYGEEGDEDYTQAQCANPKVLRSVQMGWTGEGVLTLEAGERSFTSDAAAGQTLEVKTDVSWTAKSSVPWLTLETASGDGDGIIEYSVAANTTGNSRTGTIAVTGGGQTRSCKVTQGGIPPVLGLEMDKRNFTADAASGQTLEVTANVAWTAKSDASWLKVLWTELPSSGTGVGRFAYDVAANPETDPRTGKITVSGGGLSRTFKVTQAGVTWQITTFKGNGGTPETRKTTNTISAPYGTFPSVKWSGHALVGWFTKAKGGTQVYTTSKVTVAAKRTLYAHWTTKQVATFKGNGGTPEKQKTTNTVGKTYGKLPKATWKNHVFLGWGTKPDGGTVVTAKSKVTAAAKRTLYAHWTNKQVTTFKGNGGTPETQKTTNTMGKAYGKLPVATWKNHVFLGWGTKPEGGTLVTKDSKVTVATKRTLYAHWTKKQVTTFKGNGGTPETQKTTNTMGKAYGKLPVATWKNHVFLGWGTKPDGGTAVTADSKVTAATKRTLYARWTNKQVTTFKGNGGTPDKQKTTNTMGKAYGKLPKAAWSNRVFLGWSTKPKGGKPVTAKSKVTVAAKRTLYAQWTLRKGKGAATEISGFAFGNGRDATGQTVRDTAVICTVEFEARAGVAYEIQWTPALCAEWTTLRRWAAEADGETELEVELPAAAPTGFFRVSATDSSGGTE